MNEFIKFCQTEIPNGPFHWTDEEDGVLQKIVPSSGTVLALAPHPSDPERAAIFLRRLQRKGWTIKNAICTKGVVGVLDRYVKKKNGNGNAANSLKAEIRRQEAIQSGLNFGLSEDSILFLYDRFGDIGRGDPFQDAESVTTVLKEVQPDLVILPSGNDENRTHVGVYEAFREAATQKPLEKPIIAFYHEDPKTISMDPDLYVWFDRKESLFKGELLLVHDSQQQRRLERSGEGLDDLILKTNFDRAGIYRSENPDGPTYPFAEAFNIEVF